MLYSLRVRIAFSPALYRGVKLLYSVTVLSTDPFYRVSRFNSNLIDSYMHLSQLSMSALALSYAQPLINFLIYSQTFPIQLTRLLWLRPPCSFSTSPPVSTPHPHAGGL